MNLKINMMYDMHANIFEVNIALIVRIGLIQVMIPILKWMKTNLYQTRGMKNDCFFVFCIYYYLDRVTI